MAPDELHTRLFQLLEKQIGTQRLLEQLKTLLNIEKSAAYKRLKGEKEISLTEFHILTNHFHISLDSLRGGDNFIPFYFPIHQNAIKSPAEWFSLLLPDLVPLSQKPDGQVHFTSYEVPFFYFFPFRELALFKFYNWGKYVWRFSWLNKQPFDERIFRALGDPEIPAQAERSFQLYSQIHSTELWSTEMLDETLRQVTHQYRMGALFDQKMVETLFQQIEKMVDMLEEMAEKMRKPGSNVPNLICFHNIATQTNNIVSVSTGRKRVVFTSFDYPNFIRTADHGFCDYAGDWFRTLEQGSSVQISGSNPAGRRIFFATLRKKIQEAKLGLG